MMKIYIEQAMGIREADRGTLKPIFLGRPVDDFSTWNTVLGSLVSSISNTRQPDGGKYETQS
jgi:hypothetical protein